MTFVKTFMSKFRSIKTTYKIYLNFENFSIYIERNNKKHPNFIRIFENSIRIFSRQKIRINLFMHIKLYI
jgi:hypothetical protein